MEKFGGPKICLSILGLSPTSSKIYYFASWRSRGGKFYLRIPNCISWGFVAAPHQTFAFLVPWAAIEAERKDSDYIPSILSAYKREKYWKVCGSLVTNTTSFDKLQIFLFAYTPNVMENMKKCDWMLVVINLNNHKY